MSNEFKALADLVIGEDWPVCSCGNIRDHSYRVLDGELVEVAIGGPAGRHEIMVGMQLVLSFVVTDYGFVRWVVPRGKGIVVSR